MDEVAPTISTAAIFRQHPLDHRHRGRQLWLGRSELEKLERSSTIA
jgi:hypothetical protein